MIYLLCLIASLGLVSLTEILISHMSEQESQGLEVGYIRTFLIYSLVVILVAGIIYEGVKFFNLG